MSTINKDEINKFSKIAEEWWDINGKFKPLHMFNPIRIEHIIDIASNYFKINKNKKYTNEIWGSSVNSKRNISWIFNANIILNSTNFDFKNDFLESTIIQINHLKKNYNFEKDETIKIEILSTIILSNSYKLIYSEILNSNNATDLYNSVTKNK